MTPVRLEPVAPQSPVKHSTTEPLRSHALFESIEMDHVISEVCYRGIILQRSYRKTRKSVHGTRMPPPIVFISPAIKHLRKNYKKINQQGT